MEETATAASQVASLRYRNHHKSRKKRFAFFLPLFKPVHIHYTLPSEVVDKLPYQPGGAFPCNAQRSLCRCYIFFIRHTLLIFE